MTPLRAGCILLILGALSGIWIHSQAGFGSCGEYQSKVSGDFRAVDCVSFPHDAEMKRTSSGTIILMHRGSAASVTYFGLPVTRNSHAQIGVLRPAGSQLNPLFTMADDTPLSDVIEHPSGQLLARSLNRLAWIDLNRGRISHSKPFIGSAAPPGNPVALFLEDIEASTPVFLSDQLLAITWNRNELLFIDDSSALLNRFRLPNSQMVFSGIYRESPTALLGIIEDSGKHHTSFHFINKDGHVFKTYTGITEYSVEKEQVLPRPEGGVVVVLTRKGSADLVYFTSSGHLEKRIPLKISFLGVMDPIRMLPLGLNRFILTSSSDPNVQIFDFNGERMNSLKLPKCWNLYLSSIDEAHLFGTCSDRIFIADTNGNIEAMGKITLENPEHCSAAVIDSDTAALCINRNQFLLVKKKPAQERNTLINE